MTRKHDYRPARHFEPKRDEIERDERKPGESGRDKFKRIAPGRVANVLKPLDVLGNLGCSPNYEYDDGDVAKVMGAIRAKVDQVEHILLTRSRNEPVDL